MRCIRFSRITLKGGYKFIEFAFFDFCFCQATHPILGILVCLSMLVYVLLSFPLGALGTPVLCDCASVGPYQAPR